MIVHEKQVDWSHCYEGTHGVCKRCGTEVVIERGDWSKLVFIEHTAHVICPSCTRHIPPASNSHIPPASNIEQQLIELEW